MRCAALGWRFGWGEATIAPRAEPAQTVTPSVQIWSAVLHWERTVDVVRLPASLLASMMRTLMNPKSVTVSRR